MSGTSVALLLVALVLGGIFAARRMRRPKVGGRRPPYLAALAALIDGDEETAFREFRNAVRLDSSNVDAYLRLGDLLRKRGDIDRAFQLHRELTTRRGLDPDTEARIQEALCRDLIALGRWERAADAAREAIRRATDPASALALILEVHERRGDLDEAYRAKRELLKRRGSEGASSELCAYRAAQAEGLLTKGDLKEAEKLLKEARRLDGDEPKARYLWGLLKEKQGEYTEAIDAWEGVLAAHPEKATHLFTALERVHFLNGTFSGMESTYQRFLERVPGHEDASFGLSRFLRRKGQLDAALRTCRRGLEAHPKSDALRILLLGLVLQAGRTGEAESLLNEWTVELLGEEARPAPRRPSSIDNLLGSSS
ncbi:MAG: tetratricopeptide repeat protein [bacterium]